MKKITAFICFMVFVLFAVSAADVTTYTGGGAEIPTSSLSVDFQIDSMQALRESQSTTAIPKELFFYGFYANDSDIKNGTLTFNENASGSTSGGMKYKATANFSLYLYILSNTGYKFTLTWTDLTPTDSTVSLKKIAYTVGGKDSGYTFYTFNPTTGIFYHDNWSFSATTETYTITNGVGTKEYTGTMTLTLTTT